MNIIFSKFTLGYKRNQNSKLSINKIETSELNEIIVRIVVQ